VRARCAAFRGLAGSRGGRVQCPGKPPPDGPDIQGRQRRWPVVRRRAQLRWLAFFEPRAGASSVRGARERDWQPGGLELVAHHGGTLDPQITQLVESHGRTRCGAQAVHQLRLLLIARL